MKVIHATVLNEEKWRKLSDHLPLYIEIEILP
jgi:endonuclease/exonuclease/phosphatase family metal-dependent hydrolase